MAEIVFILEPDTGRVTVESSQASAQIAKEINNDLGASSVVNCARPKLEIEKSSANKIADNCQNKQSGNSIYLYRIYHHSTVDGPGRRSVVQVAGCSIRCAGCYVPETHERSSGRIVSIDEIIDQIDEHRCDHDGVTILGGEPFDQPEGLEILVARLRSRNYHITVYTGYRIERLWARLGRSVSRILENIDLLIDGPFDRDLTRGAGEYRGSSNQRLIHHPILRRKA